MATSRARIGKHMPTLAGIGRVGELDFRPMASDPLAGVPTAENAPC